MAAYDLRVQKPSSLAVPKGPGADDLARFLSVSESNRANTQREQIQRDTLDWEKGAQERALAAAEAERERVRQDNMARGRTSTEAVDRYLSNSQEDFRLSDGTLKQFDEMFPNATPEQRDGVRQAARDRITQTPGAYIDQKQMGYDLENTLVNDHGWGRKQAQQEAARQMSAHFAAPGKMDDEVKKGYVDAIGDSGIADNLLSYYKGNSGSKGSGDSDFMKSVKFLQDRQLDYEGNNLRQGSRPFYSWNLPFTDHELYTDDMNRLSSAIQQEAGVDPMYVNSVILSRAENGKIPDGVSPEDLTDKDGDYYEAIKADAKRLQGIAEGGQGGSVGREGINPEALREVKQNEMDARFKALGELDAALQSRGGRPLTSEEQFQIMSDPELLREFDLVMSQVPNQRPDNTTTRSGENPAPRTVEESGTDTSSGSEEAAVEGDNPELDALLGADSDGGGDSSGSSEVVSPQESTTPVQGRRRGMGPQAYREMQREFAERLGFARDQEEEAEEPEIADPLENISLRDMREAIPPGADRRKAYRLFESVKSGRGSESEIEELLKMLNSAKQ